MIVARFLESRRDKNRIGTIFIQLPRSTIRRQVVRRLMVFLVKNREQFATVVRWISGAKNLEKE